MYLIKVAIQLHLFPWSPRYEKRVYRAVDPATEDEPVGYRVLHIFQQWHIIGSAEALPILCVRCAR